MSQVAIKPYDIQKLVVQIEQITGRPALPPESAGGRLGILERAEGPSNDSGYFTATHTPPTGTGL